MSAVKLQDILNPLHYWELECYWQWCSWVVLIESDSQPFDASRVESESSKIFSIRVKGESWPVRVES